MLNSLKETSMRDRQARLSMMPFLKLKYLPGNISRNWGRVHISGKHQLKGLKCEPVPNSRISDGPQMSRSNVADHACDAGNKSSFLHCLSLLL